MWIQTCAQDQYGKYCNLSRSNELICCSQQLATLNRAVLEAHQHLNGQVAFICQQPKEEEYI